MTVLQIVSLMILHSLLIGCGEDPERARQQKAIENAKGALKLSIPSAREEGAYGREVLVPGYRHAMDVLDKAKGAGLTPELFIATMVTLPEGVRLELNWLDFGTRVSALRLKNQQGKAHDFPITAHWADEEKKRRSETAWQIEAVVIRPQDTPDVDTTVTQFGPRPAIKLPKTWLDEQLTASVVFDDGEAGNEVKVTRHTRP
jgi:hypothetical protein